jgi:acyl carrier protein
LRFDALSWVANVGRIKEIAENGARMNVDRQDIEGKVKKAILSTVGRRMELKESDSFVAALGFNSLRMVSLSLALEDEFGTPLLLGDWISQCDDPGRLTVGSLCDYISGVLRRDC